MTKTTTLRTCVLQAKQWPWTRTDSIRNRWLLAVSQHAHPSIHRSFSPFSIQSQILPRRRVRM
jgi:hypothetical protein